MIADTENKIEINISKNDHLDQMTLKEVLINVQRYIDYFKSKWKLILMLMLIGGALGFLNAYFKKSTYKAALSFALEDEKGGSGGGLMGLASQLGFDPGGSSAGGAFSNSNLIELMKSRTLIQKALLSTVEIENKKTTLADYYLLLNLNGIKNKWKLGSELYDVRFPINSDDSKFTLNQNRVMGAIFDGILTNLLTVGQKDKKSSISYIEVKSENELFSKYFTEKIAIVVSEFYVDTKSKKALQNLAIIQKQTDSIRNELNAGMLGVASANDNTFNLNPALNVKRLPSARKQLDVQANSAMLSQLVQNLEIAKVSLRKETPLIQIIDKPILPLPKDSENPFKGLLLGVVLAFFLSIFSLTFTKWLKGVLQN